MNCEWIFTTLLHQNRPRFIFGLVSFGLWVLQHHEVQLVVLGDENFEFPRTNSHRAEIVILVELVDGSTGLVDQILEESCIAKRLARGHGALLGDAFQIEHDHVQNVLLLGYPFDALIDVTSMLSLFLANLLIGLRKDAEELGSFFE